MTDQHQSEQGLFEDPEVVTVPQVEVEQEGFPSSSSGSPSGSPSSGHHRKRSSLKRPANFPIMPDTTPRTPPRVAEPQAQEGTQAQDTSKSTGTGGTVLGMTQVKGQPILVRTRNGTQVDFWKQITKLTAANLEAVLQLAKTDKAYDMDAFIQGILYQGFDRIFYIKAALNKVSVEHFCQFAVLGAIRGSNLTKIVEKSEHVPPDLLRVFNTAGFVKTPKKRDDLTILRCTASIPHWCAFWMHKFNVAKKMAGEDCPAAIQFPGAASLPMSRGVRTQHLKFCQAFSSVLPGGTFNVNIYLTAYANMIPVSDIPQEILPILGVSSDAEARIMSAAEIQENYSKAVVKA